MKQIKFKAKIIIYVPTELIKFVCLVKKHIKNIYLKMNIVGFLIFISLLANHTKITLSNIDILFSFSV